MTYTIFKEEVCKKIEELSNPELFTLVIARISNYNELSIIFSIAQLKRLEIKFRDLIGISNDIATVFCSGKFALLVETKNLEKYLNNLHDIHYIQFENKFIPISAVIGHENIKPNQAEEAFSKAFATTLVNNPHNKFASIQKDFDDVHTFITAIQENRLRFAFQPIISCKTGKIEYYECLLRIVDKSGKLVSAGPFIPLAEEYGFIELINFFVIENAYQELIHADDSLMLSINISQIGISDERLRNKILERFSDRNLAKRMIFEITETALNKDLNKIKQFVEFIHSLGSKIAIDDFGAGYTSFKHLKTLTADIIKIDGNFVKDVLYNVDNKVFVETLVRIAQELGAKTVAEFVENGEIAKYLINIEVDLMQGNYFSPALGHRKWEQK